MSTQQTGRLILLSGPSCMGKGSMVKALKKFFPKVYRNLKRVLLYNSRPPRPGETDGVEFRFRPRGYIEEVAKRKKLVTVELRGDLHALDVRKLTKIVAKHDALLIDSPFMIAALRGAGQLPNVPTISIMMVPLSRDEILFYKKRKKRIFPLEDFVVDLMRRKLLRRTRKQKNILSAPDLEAVELRAKSAYLELREAHHFDHILVNHEGGEAEFWNSFYYPVGDPLRCLRAFAKILKGKKPKWVEKWEEGLVP